MSDRDKIALLCILIVLAIAIWLKPLKRDFVAEKENDIFQESQSEAVESIVKIPLRMSPDKKKLIEETVKGDFGPSPFRK